MKYREEVMSKIFTYITVIILLGIIAFEAYLLQTERNKISELEEQNRQTYKDLITAREINYDLQVEKSELKKFQNQWITYAAYTESADVERYKTDLYSRINLIPEEAIADWKERKLELLLEEMKADNAQSEEAESADAEDDDEKEAELSVEDIEDPVFTFENPKGENLFLPFGHAEDPSDQVLIYTCVYPESKDEEGRILLMYELPLLKGRQVPRYDENNEIIWNCIAYNVGEGWIGICPEKEGDED